MNTTLTATSARANLYKLIEEAGETHRPITITGRRNNVVMVAEEDWNAIQETLFLTSIPGMRESIVKGMKTDVTDCSTNLKW